MYERHLQAPHGHELDVEFAKAKHQPNVLEVNNNLAIATQASGGTAAEKSLISTEDALIYQSCNLFIACETQWSSHH